MATYAEIAANLLVEASDLLIRLGQNNPEVDQQMQENAATFQKMAMLIRQDPSGSLENLSHGEMAGRLLNDAATFFVSIAQSNEPIREAMEQNANVFRHIAQYVQENPTGIVPEDPSEG